MQISSNLFYDTASKRMSGLNDRATLLQTQIATGKKIQTPSDDAVLAQQIAEWEAEGNDIEDFPLDGRRGDYDGYDDEDDDGSNAVPVNRVGRLTDPLAVKTWMGQDYRLFGIPVQFLLVGMAVVVGVIMAIAGVIL